MSLSWEVLDRRARNADLLGVTALLLKATEEDRLAFGPEVEKHIKGMSADDWWTTRNSPAGGYALAVIGCMPSAARAAGLLCRRGMRDGWERPLADRFLAVARARELPWVGDLGVRLAARVGQQDVWTPGWLFVSALLREGGALPPVTEGVVRCWLGELHQSDAEPVPLVVRLRRSPYLDLLLPSVFSIDGLGGDLTGGAWDEDTGTWDTTPRFSAAVAQLVAEGRLDRGPIVDATVDRLVRGDRPAWLRPFAVLHEALSPTADELADHVGDYARLLADAPSAVAGLAQRALRTVDDAGRLDLDTLLEASVPALLRKEKTLVRAQLGWLEKVSRREPDRLGEVLETVAAAFGHPALDVQERALTLIGRSVGQLDAATVERLADRAAALAGDLPARAAAMFGVAAPPAPTPGVAALPPPLPSAAMPPPIADAAELAEEVVALAHEESAVRWERVLAGLVALSATAGPAVLAAALEPVLDRLTRPVWDRRDRLVRLGEAIRGVIAPVTSGQSPVSQSSVPRRRRDWAVPFPPDRVLSLRLAEVGAQLPTAPVPMLVGTPTSVNGSLDAGILLERLQRAETDGWQPWPVDFEQALLRVPRAAGDDVPARAAALTSPMGRRFAEWLATGGLPDPVSTRLVQRDPGSPVERRAVVNLRPARTGGLRLEDGIATLTHRPTTAYYSTDLIEETDILTMVLPHHRDVTAAWALHSLAALAIDDARGGAVLLPLLAECSGPIGPAMALGLVYGLGARHESDRVAAVDAFLALAAGDEPFAAAAGADLGDLGGDGVVKLSRVVTALGDAHRAGATAAAWELLAAALPPLLPKAPRGLPDLLELATLVASAIGARAEIAELTEVAARSGSSRLRTEARRLRTVLAG